MSQLFTLFRRKPRDFRGSEMSVEYEPVGEFRKVPWCRTHDAPFVIDKEVCFPFYFLEMYRNKACVSADIWVQAV